MVDKSKLEKLKELYKSLKEKYDLPEFGELNKEFAIERIAETETDFLTREIRRFISDKIYNYLRLCETLMNPSNAPLFVFSIVKSMSPEDKKKISEAYSKLSRINLGLVGLDLEFNEKEDSVFIKKTLDSWKNVSKDIFGVIQNVKWADEKEEGQSNSSYLG